MPSHGAGRLAGRKREGAFASPLFPCSLHAAPTDRPPGATESRPNLLHSVPCRFRDLADHCGGPQAFGRRHWFSDRTAHLGTKPPSEPSLMMPGIIISFVFSEQNRLVFCTTPSENQLTSPKEPVDNAPNRLGIQ